ncbi:MAG: glutamate-1-semialdehyde 2,1-aminomutase [Sphingomonas sp.]|uniref:glutamate-1-semialdehyde 2,1-aminomutase n=1 Tax=Sphingomonas sp. TaxID=28214 RepID=UPI0025E662D9|nr:glutamate-1-semialdehyde 2,1-aminomutase [Sphingomonas sp.]MBX9881063.1 glutamate-1-semialdehyde 2,1-aminomutase [Sphingomonas sp.]
MTDSRSNTKGDFAALRARLHRAIPGGAHTYSRGDDQFPAIAPPVLARGKGAYVWDTQGNRYLDYGMALRAVTIGYADERVNRAAIAQIDNGVNLTRASTIELEAAERLTSLIPSAEMVKFAKNGSNVTTAAVKIARAYTRRRYVCVPRQHPFFSFDDWFIGTTPIQRGVDAPQVSSTLVFDYNDMASLEALFDAHGSEIAAVMMEPATHILPCRGCATVSNWPATSCAACPNAAGNFLHRARHLAHRHGALFILDEMITGFRWNLRGAQAFFGIEPDLSTFGKAMANGFSLAAVTGKREFMKVGAIDEPGMERTFLLSSTHGGEMPALGAFIAATEINETEDVAGHLWAYGARFRAGWEDCAARHGLADHLVLEGPAVALNYVTRGADGAPSPAMRTLLAQEMLKRGVMMPWLAFAQAHGADELALTLDALDGAMAVYANALSDGIDGLLEGPAVKPVFRSHN